MFTGCFVLSMFVFSPSNKLRDFLQKVFPNYHIIQWILSYLTYATYLTIMALLSYIIFHIQMSILFISIYAKLIDWAVESKFYKQVKANSTVSIQ